MKNDNYLAVSTWPALLDLAREEIARRGFALVYYKAPLDARPVMVEIVKVYKNNKVRVWPYGTGVEPFTADSRHLDRFYLRRP